MFNCILRSQSYSEGVNRVGPQLIHGITAQNRKAAADHAKPVHAGPVKIPYD